MENIDAGIGFGRYEVNIEFENGDNQRAYTDGDFEICYRTEDLPDSERGFGVEWHIGAHDEATDNFRDFDFLTPGEDYSITDNKLTITQEALNTIREQGYDRILVIAAGFAYGDAYHKFFLGSGVAGISICEPYCDRLMDDRTLVLGDGDGINENRSQREESAAYPDSADFECLITKVESADDGIVNVEKDGDNYNFKALNRGETTLTISYDRRQRMWDEERGEEVYGQWESRTETVNVNVVSSKYDININSVYDYDVPRDNGFDITADIEYREFNRDTQKYPGKLSGKIAVDYSLQGEGNCEGISLNLNGKNVSILVAKDAPEQEFRVVVQLYSYNPDGTINYHDLLAEESKSYCVRDEVFSGRLDESEIYYEITDEESELDLTDGIYFDPSLTEYTNENPNGIKFTGAKLDQIGCAINVRECRVDGRNGNVNANACYDPGTGKIKVQLEDVSEDECRMPLYIYVRYEIQKDDRNYESEKRITICYCHEYEQVGRIENCDTDYDSVWECKHCGKTEIRHHEAGQHNYCQVSKLPAGKLSGAIVKRCADCGKYEITVIPKVQSEKLAKTEYVYTGSAIKPTVTIKDEEGKALSEGTDYELAYSNNTGVGTATVTIYYRGNYDGTKSLTYSIVPKGTTLSKVTAGKKSFTATWKKQATETGGYEIQYSTSKTMKSAKTVKVTGAKTTSTTVKKLTSKKTYYVKIRTFKKVGTNTYYSSWSAVKSVKVK